MQITIQITNYYPSGLPWDYNAGSGADLQPYKYNGKEFIEENGLDTYDYGARGYYAAIGRFTTPDPLAERFYSYSPYSYVLNRFVRFVDINGLAPGDPFKTKIDAANDFALYYNGTSIKMSREFGSAIYKNSDGTYSYTIACIGSNDETYINERIPSETTLESKIHTHGSEEPDYDNNNFSKFDLKDVELNEYLVTPSGKLLEYDVSTKTSFEPAGASKDIPSDSKSGENRVNTVEAKDTKPIYIDPETDKIYNK